MKGEPDKEKQPERFRREGRWCKIALRCFFAEYNVTCVNPCDTNGREIVDQGNCTAAAYCHWNPVTKRCLLKKRELSGSRLNKLLVWQHVKAVIVFMNRYFSHQN